MLCSLLRQKLADEKAARRVGQDDLNDARNELRDLNSQVTQQKEEQQAALAALRQELTEEQETALSTLKQELTKEYEDTSGKIIDDWKKHYEGQLADLRTKLGNASQSHGSAAGATAQLEADLASAKQQINDLQRVKSEDSAAEQRAAEAQKQVSCLESSLRAAQADLASSSQSVLQAKSETQDMQRQLHGEKDKCETLRYQTQAAQHEFDNTVKEMMLKTAEYAKQYAEDVQDARSQHGDHRDSGGRSHKRSRDSSNGRDSKRRS